VSPASGSVVLSVPMVAFGAFSATVLATRPRRWRLVDVGDVDREGLVEDARPASVVLTVTYASRPLQSRGAGADPELISRDRDCAPLRPAGCCS